LYKFLAFNGRYHCTDTWREKNTRAFARSLLGIFICTIRKSYHIVLSLSNALESADHDISSLELRVGTLASDCAFDQAVGISLRRVHFCVRAGVLEAIEPAKICEWSMISNGSVKAKSPVNPNLPISK
jgi:hypothetical protein